MNTSNQTPRKKIMVISHERSGTHFLMNSIGKHFNYVAKPWVNFDFNLGLNFYSIPTLQQYFKQLEHQAIANIFKSHHSVDFLAELLPYLIQHFHIFYIYRDPRDVMVSGWRITNRINYHDQSLTKSSVGEYIRAEPAGWKMRYQMRQEKNMLQRWKTHVNGWLSAAEQLNQNNPNAIKLLRYEQLNLAFEQTIADIAQYLDTPHASIEKPAVDDNVIGDGQGKVGKHNQILSAEDLQFFEDELGDYMRQLNYL